MGTLGLMMAVSALGAEYINPTTAKVPVTGTVQLGDVTPTTEIVVDGTLDFGTMTPSLTTDNADGLNSKQMLTVKKKVGTEETVVSKGGYKYKIAPGNKGVEVLEAHGITEGIDSHPEIFKDKSGNYVKIADLNQQFQYSGRAEAQHAGLGVWFSGYVNPELEGNEYTVDANVFVQLVDSAK